MREDYARLQAHLSGMGSVVIAFSGGVDSSLLLAAAAEALEEKVLAVTIDSPVHTARELEDALETARFIGARHLVIAANEITDPLIRANTPDRCYHCKKKRFLRLIEIARQEGFEQVLEGSNHDDLADHRPGLRAAEEVGTRAPFVELAIGKQAIREMARERGLKVWDKPSASCLATRIPFGEEITPARIRRIETAEERLHAFGFRELRVRDHGSLARIEARPDELARFLEPEIREQVLVELRAAGYIYISLDLGGYRTGSMDEGLELPDRPPR